MKKIALNANTTKQDFLIALQIEINEDIRKCNVEYRNPFQWSIFKIAAINLIYGALPSCESFRRRDEEYLEQAIKSKEPIEVEIHRGREFIKAWLIYIDEKQSEIEIRIVPLLDEYPSTPDRYTEFVDLVKEWCKSHNDTSGDTSINNLSTFKSKHKQGSDEYWKNIFDWFYSRPDKVRTIKELATLIGYSESTVYTKHSEYNKKQVSCHKSPE